MADAFDAYFGAGTGLKEDSQPMINALRGQKREGDFASLSTIGQISDLGKSQSRQALAAGKRAGGLKMSRELEQRKLVEADKQARTLATSKLAATKLANENKEKAAKLKAEATVKAEDLKYDDFKTWVSPDGAKKNLAEKQGKVYELDAAGNIQPSSNQGMVEYKEPTDKSKSAANTGKLTKSERKDFEEGSAEGLEALNILGGYNRDYSVSETLGMDIQGTPLNSLDNYMVGTVGIGSERDKTKANWWRTLQRFVELPARHELFGSALTATEKAAWEKAAIAETLAPDEAEALVHELEGIIRERIRRGAGNSLFKGASSEYIRFNTDNMYTDMASLDVKEDKQNVNVQGAAVEEITAEELKILKYTREEAEAAGFTLVED